MNARRCVALALSWLLVACAEVPARAEPAHASELFWRHWSDGKAELSGYELVQPRYGELRRGRAVLVYVTEPFSRSKRVKVDRHDPSNPDHVVVMKLNHVRRFQTGIYDYGLLTSVFVDPNDDFRPLKISFSAQEWCGHVYEEATFDADRAAVNTRSYFEGETTEATLPLPEGTLSEDALYIAVRQLGGEKLAAMKAEGVLPGATFRRLQHKPLALHAAPLSWDGSPKRVDVPAGAFEVAEARYTRPDGTTCTFQVEVPYPHKIVGWSCTDGEHARLTGSTRLPYWQTHGEGDEKLLQQLGLAPMRATP